MCKGPAVCENLVPTMARVRGRRGDDSTRGSWRAGVEGPVTPLGATEGQSNGKPLEGFKQRNDMIECTLFNTSLWVLGGKCIVKNQNGVGLI